MNSKKFFIIVLSFIILLSISCKSNETPEETIYGYNPSSGTYTSTSTSGTYSNDSATVTINGDGTCKITGVAHRATPTGDTNINFDITVNSWKNRATYSSQHNSSDITINNPTGLTGGSVSWYQTEDFTTMLNIYLNNAGSSSASIVYECSVKR